MNRFYETLKSGLALLCLIILLVAATTNPLVRRSAIFGGGAFTVEDDGTTTITATLSPSDLETSQIQYPTGGTLTIEEADGSDTAIFNASNQIYAPGGVAFYTDTTELKSNHAGEFDIANLADTLIDVISCGGARFQLDADGDGGAEEFYIVTPTDRVFEVGYDGDVDILGTVEIGPTDSVTADADGDDLKVENTGGNVGMSVLASTTGLAGIYMGDTTNPDEGGVIYNNSGPSIALWANGQSWITAGGSGSIGIQGTMTASGGTNDIGTSSTPFDDVFFTDLEAVAGTFSGDLSTTAMLNLATDGTALTVVSNAITVTKSYHLVAGGTVNDINGGTDGDILYLTCSGYAPPLTIAHNSGSGTSNIRTKTAASLTISGNTPGGTNDLAILIHRGTEWLAWEIQP